jgi:threonine dehydratase
VIPLEDIRAARERVAGHVHRTPLWQSSTLSRRFGTNVYLKLELFQKTGSFKPRGAFNQLMVLLDGTDADRVVGVSGGNFAQGLAYAGSELGVATTLVMAEGTPQHYIDATRGYGAQVEFAPDIAGAFARVDQLAAEGAVAAHPFDHPAMMAGNGSLGLEVIEDVPDLTDVFISVGGGGFITGVGSAILGVKPGVRIHAVETDGAQVLHESLALGKPATMTPTSLSRTLGSPYLAQAAFDFAVDHVATSSVVTDEQAYRSLVYLMERAKVVTEIAASCTLAALEADADRFGPRDHVVLVLCGGNTSAGDLADYRERFGP